VVPYVIFVLIANTQGIDRNNLMPYRACMDICFGEWLQRLRKIVELIDAAELLIQYQHNVEDPPAFTLLEKAKDLAKLGMSESSQEGALVESLPPPPADYPEPVLAAGISTLSLSRRPAKKKRRITPEVRAKRIAALVLAREAKAKKMQERRGTQRPIDEPPKNPEAVAWATS
jgi:hypothetical protein